MFLEPRIYSAARLTNVDLPAPTWDLVDARCLQSYRIFGFDEYVLDLLRWFVDGLYVEYSCINRPQLFPVCANPSTA